MGGVTRHRNQATVKRFGPAHERDAKMMKATHHLEGAKCWTCEAEVSAAAHLAPVVTCVSDHAFGGGTPETLVQAPSVAPAVRYGAFLRAIPPTRRAHPCV